VVINDLGQEKSQVSPFFLKDIIKTDILNYALTVVLYVCGRSPFVVSTLRAHSETSFHFEAAMKSLNFLIMPMINVMMMLIIVACNQQQEFTRKNPEILGLTANGDLPNNSGEVLVTDNNLPQDPPVVGDDPDRRNPPVAGDDPDRRNPPVVGDDPDRRNPPVAGDDPDRRNPPVVVDPVGPVRPEPPVINLVMICYQTKDQQVLETEVDQFLAMGALLGPCADYVNPVVNSFTQNAQGQNKVDILFVVDNSGSMGGDQTNLANNFENFISSFLAQQTLPDFRIFITSTDPRSNKPFGDGKLSGDGYLDTAMAVNNPADFISKFKTRVKLGTNGSGDECSVNGALRGLQRNVSLFRQDAILVTTMISDENDVSLTWAQKTLEEFVNEIKLIKGNMAVKLNSIVNFQTYGQYETKGEIQMAASDMTGGKKADILTDFSSTLQELGQNIVDLISSFPLSEPPFNVNEIVVKVNGVPVNSWVYDAELNSIAFTTAPPAGAQIAVEYSTFN
jgi:hypothetical protein